MPYPKIPNGQTRQAKRPDAKTAGKTKLATSSSISSLPTGDIDWKVFGLNLDPPPGAVQPVGGGQPGGAPHGGTTTAEKSGRRSPPNGIRLESLKVATPKAQPFDSTDLSHLRSATKRTPGYTLGLPPLSQLLEDRGVDYSMPNGDRDVQLPLEAFEDTTMWTRTPQEWQELMRDPMTGAPTPLACRALSLQEGGSGRWQNAVVTSWDAENQRYSVRWSSGQEDKVLSVHVLFDGDDPVLFADRLAKALKQRRYANSLLKYHFFIDSMPEDRSRRIGRESAARISQLAKTGVVDPNTEFADRLERKLEQLMEEAQKAYIRVQNAITFEKVRTQGSLGVLPTDLELPPPEPPREVPYLAVKVLPAPRDGPADPAVPRGFRQAFEWFCKSSLLIRPEVCAALQVTRSMCLDLLTEQVFETSLLAPLRLPEFVEREEASVMRLKGRLGMWVNTIRMRITQCLQQAAVKWFHLNETSLESYRASRLRPLLVCARLMMSNAFLLLGGENFKGYVEALEACVPARVEFPQEPDSLKKAKNIFAGAQADAPELVVEPFFKQSLFRLELQVADVDGKDERSARRSGRRTSNEEASDQPPFEFGTKPEEFKEAMVIAFEKGVRAFQDVHSVESVLLPHIIRDDHLDPNFRESDDWVQEFRARVETACDVHVPWLQQVLQLVEEFKDVVYLNPDAKINELREAKEPANPVLVRQEIEERQRRQAEIMERLPGEREQVPVGFYRVDLSAARVQLCEKLELSSQLLLRWLAERLAQNIQDATGAFSNLSAKLRQEVTTIEECAELREYVKSVPGELAQLQGPINDAMALTDLVEDLRVLLPPETLDARWEMFALPANVKARVVKVEEYLDSKHKELLNKQENDQKEFAARLAGLEQVIGDFQQYRDMGQLREVTEKVRITNEEIRQCQDLAKLYNSREALFDRPQTDYSSLGELIKAFEPYSNLWRTAGDWMKNKETWMRGSFDQIDPQQCENQVTGGTQLLSETIETLQENEEARSVCLIAEQVKAELEEFSAYLPLVAGLRGTQVAERHWEQISQLCGVKVGPGMEGGFTLRRLLDVGLLSALDEILAICNGEDKESQPQPPT